MSKKTKAREPTEAELLEKWREERSAMREDVVASVMKVLLELLDWEAEIGDEERESFLEDAIYRISFTMVFCKDNSIYVSPEMVKGILYMTISDFIDSELPSEEVMDALSEVLSGRCMDDYVDYNKIGAASSSPCHLQYDEGEHSHLSDISADIDDEQDESEQF